MENEVITPQIAIPQGAKVILPVEPITPIVKKERSEAQKAALAKMRKARDESNQRRKFSREQLQEQMDVMKKEEEAKEEQERQQKAAELEKTLGVEVILQKKRGRKAGEHIPYNPINVAPGIVRIKEPVKVAVPVKHPHKADPQGLRALGDANSLGEPKVAVPEPKVAVPEPKMAMPVKHPQDANSLGEPKPAIMRENPYLEMIRRKKR